MRRSISAILLTLISIFVCSCATEELRDNTVIAGSTTTDLLYEMVLSNIAMVRYFNGDNSNLFQDWNQGKDLDLTKLNDKRNVELYVKKGDPASIGNPELSATTLKLQAVTDLPKRITPTPESVPEGQFRTLNATQGNVLPWAYDLTGANIAVNDSIGITTTLGADVATADVLHPSLSMPLSRGKQQSWAVTPITDTIALNVIKDYYYKASLAKSTIPSNRGRFIYRNGTPPMGCLKGGYRGKWVWIPSDDPEAMANLTHLTQQIMAAVEDAGERIGARKAGKAPVDTQPVIFVK